MVKNVGPGVMALVRARQTSPYIKTIFAPDSIMVNVV